MRLRAGISLFVTIASALVLTQSAGAAPAAAAVDSPCPADLASLERMLAGHRVVSSKPSGYGNTGVNRYSAAEFRILGATPTDVEASTTDGKLVGFEAMLPGGALKPYRSAFTAAYPGAQCFENSCTWSLEQPWNAPAGALVKAKINTTILSKTKMAFDCTYR